MSKEYKYSKGFIQVFLVLLGILVLGGVMVWSFVVLPQKQQQAQLGAGVIEALPGEEPQTPQGVARIRVFLESSQVKPGQGIRFTVGAPELSAISRSVEVFLEGPGGQTSQTNIWNIDGEGQWYDNITIPQNAQEGTWKVKTVAITDNNGNLTAYSYGTDIFSTFTVVGGQ